MMPMRIKMIKSQYAISARIVTQGSTIVRVAVSAFLALLLPAFAFAQGTYAPDPVQVALDNSGNIVVGGKLCVYTAGTSTPATTYADAAYAASNTNPVIADSAGRMTVFLVPGTAYKFVLRQPGTDTTCATGSVLWTRDNILGVPISAANVDVAATAGETITAGQVVYLSDGSGSKTAGSWYLADADLLYGSVWPEIGIAPSAITSGATGTVRIMGRVTGLSGFTPGISYFVSATAGAVTASVLTNSRYVGHADSTTTLVLTPNPRSDRADNGINDFRLTLTTGVPVTTADVTAATTLYCTPAGRGNRIALYDSAGVATIAMSAELSIAVPATTSQMYDVFAYGNAGVATLELLAWTNDTTRATAIVLTTTGTYTKSGDLTRRYLGSFRTTAVSGQTEDSVAKRYVWNYYNRVRRTLYVTDATASWTYSTATYQQARATATNQVAVVIGVAEATLDLIVAHFAGGNAGAIQIGTGIGEDVTNAIPTGFIGGAGVTCGGGGYCGATLAGRLTKYPAVGYHFYAWLEKSAASGTTTWGPYAYGPLGLSGWIEG